jgi:Bax protein
MHPFAFYSRLNALRCAAFLGLTVMALVATGGGSFAGLSGGFAPTPALELWQSPTIADGETANAERYFLTGGRSVHSLRSNFAAHDYDLATVRNGQARVPRIFVSALPHDLSAEHAAANRKETFLAALLPIILRTNEAILADRKRLLKVAAFGLGNDLPADESLWLADLAASYKLDRVDLAILKRRVDVVPPSLALAQAAEESGWGTSRFAQTGNAVYGERTWDRHAGLAPRIRARASGSDTSFQVRTFAGVETSVVAYMRNLNSGGAYADFRSRRADLRRTGRPIDGLTLAPTLQRYSTRGPAYVAGLAAIIRSNDLADFDRAALYDSDPTQL